MKKLNKKGFTLIEMLVVIAIIAILVAIIIPIVSSATQKAAAATNAANMRSYKAEVVTSYLSNDGNVVVNSSKKITTNTIKTPAMKAVKSDDPNVNCTKGDAGITATNNDNVTAGSGKWNVKFDGSDFIVTYDGYTIAQMAAVAGQDSAQGGSGS